MKRRAFLKAGLKAGGAGVATAATGALAAPAIAQGVQQWRMVTAWPKNLPGPGVAAQLLADRITALSRSEERRVGKECVSTCRSRWSPSHSKKNTSTRVEYRLTYQHNTSMYSNITTDHVT